MEILENKTRWDTHFRAGWLTHLGETGSVSWDGYEHPRNQDVPGMPGVDLRRSRLMLISSAGAYLRGSQPPFDAANLYGDYTIRTFPSATPFDALGYAHDHFDHTMVEQDAQVALPLRFLEGMVADDVLGALAPSVVSFMGYQPDAGRVIDDLIPQVLRVARDEAVHAALLAPV